MLLSRGHGSDCLRVLKHICFEMSTNWAVCSASFFLLQLLTSSSSSQKKNWNQVGCDEHRHKDQTHDQRNVTHDDPFVDPEFIIREEDWANHKVD